MIKQNLTLVVISYEMTTRVRSSKKKKKKTPFINSKTGFFATPAFKI